MKAPYIRWTEQEKAIVKAYWNTTQLIRQWMHLLPGRTEDHIRKAGRRMKLGVRVEVKHHSNAWVCVEQLLGDGKMRTIREIGKKTGFSDTRIRALVREHVGHEIYVADWSWEDNRHAAMFALGRNKPNKTRPKYKATKTTPKPMFEPIIPDAPHIDSPKRADLAANWMFNPIAA